MSTDAGMDLEEELLPLVGGDALHEYPRWTSFVEFVTERDEGLGASSDLSCFSPLGWENLLEEIGKLRCSPVGLIECHHGNVDGRHHHGGTGVGAPERWASVGVHLDRSF